MKTLTNNSNVKRFVLFFGMLLMVQIINAQWITQSIGGAFSDKGMIMAEQGISNEFPYEKPYLFVRLTDKILIYFTEVPYAGCEGSYISISIDDKKPKSYLSTTDAAGKAWFIKIKRGNEELINEMRNGSKMEIRLRSNCLQYSATFDLTGTDEAFNKIGIL